MKKIIIALLVFILATFFLSACSNEAQEDVNVKVEATETSSTEESPSLKPTIEEAGLINEAESIEEDEKKEPVNKTEPSKTTAGKSAGTTAPVEESQPQQVDAVAESQRVEDVSDTSIEEQDNISDKDQNAPPPESQENVSNNPPEPVYDSSIEYNAAVAYLIEKGCNITVNDGQKIQFWYGSCNCRIYDCTKDGVWNFSGGDSVVNEPFWYTCGTGELLDTIKIVVQ